MRNVPFSIGCSHSMHFARPVGAWSTYGNAAGFALPFLAASAIAASSSARLGTVPGYSSSAALSSAGSLAAAHITWCHARLGASLNWVWVSTPSRSSPLAIGFLHVRQLARPDFASSITFAMTSRVYNAIRRDLAVIRRDLARG